MYSNFLEAYKVYSSGNEAPPIFHRWTALSCLACFASRRVWVPQGFFTVYPNLYTVFVGNPGNGKSTAMRIGKDLVRGLEKYCPIVPPSITREALTQDMGDKESKYFKEYMYQGKKLEYTPALVFANEIVTLLGTNPIGMIEFFTDIWDEDMFEVKTKNKGTDVIPRPFVNMLACMTPETTSNLLKESIISGGFARRCIFVYAQRKGEAVPRPTLTVEQLEAKDWCIKWGAQLCHLVGEFKWTTEAESVFDQWYYKNHQFVATNADVWSKSALVLKVAMLLALANSLDLLLEAKHINLALNMLAENEVDMGRVFAGTGRNPEASIASRIMAMIDAAPEPMVARMVHVKMFEHGNESERNQAIAHLVSAGKLKTYSYQPKPGMTEITVVGTPLKVDAFVVKLASVGRTPPPEPPVSVSLASEQADLLGGFELTLTGHHLSHHQDEPYS
jgi:hypothetical protein